MKLLTLNLWNYERDWPARLDRIARCIRDHQPDVVTLQESRHDFRRFRGRGQAEQVADITGFYCTSAIAQVYVPMLRVDEGLAILTRQSPAHWNVRRLRQFPYEREDENRRICLHVAVAVDASTLNIFNTHWSLSSRAREANALDSWESVVSRSGEAPALLAGDLNAEPGELAIQFLGGQADIEGRRGDMVDAWTSVHGADPGFTYASWDPVRRIDYVFTRNMPAASNITVLGEDRDGRSMLSDHMGLLVEFPAPS